MTSAAAAVSPAVLTPIHGSENSVTRGDSGQKYSNNPKEDSTRAVFAFVAIARGMVDDNGQRILRSCDTTESVCCKVLTRKSKFVLRVNGETFRLVEMHPSRRTWRNRTHLEARVQNIKNNDQHLVSDIPLQDFIFLH